MSKRTRGAGIPTPGNFMRVGDPRIRYASMLSALETLYAAKPREYTAIACLICCYLDAIAARGGKGGRKVLVPFLRRNFKQLCKGLSLPGSRKDGADVFYTQFRDEMIHTYFSRDPKYAIAEDWELNGAYVGCLTVGGRTYTAVNVDCLYRDFRALARRRMRLGRL